MTTSDGTLANYGAMIRAASDPTLGVSRPAIRWSLPAATEFADLCLALAGLSEPGTAVVREKAAAVAEYLLGVRYAEREPFALDPGPDVVAQAPPDDPVREVAQAILDGRLLLRPHGGTRQGVSVYSVEVDGE